MGVFELHEWSDAQSDRGDELVLVMRVLQHTCRRCEDSRSRTVLAGFKRVGKGTLGAREMEAAGR
jgi:hypothetical protein